MNALVFRNIRHTFGDRVVLNIPDLSIEKGQRVALVGPNGSGKTTLLSIAAILTQPEQGQISIDGEKLNWNQPDSHRRKISYMAQEPYFFRGSLISNMKFALAASSLSKEEQVTRISKYISMLNLEGIEKRSPRTFSTGERKRSAIARVLCRETEIVLLDEPFTHIDSTSAGILENAITMLPASRTVVFSTHDLSYAYRLADRVVTLQNGTISPWTPENIFRMTAFTSRDGFELKPIGNGSGNTGKSRTPVVYYPGELTHGKSYTLSVNPREVLVSREKIESSARNSFEGSIRRIDSAGPRTVLATIECTPEISISAMLTERAMKELSLSVGDTAWAHFKSTAIHVFS